MLIVSFVGRDPRRNRRISDLSPWSCSLRTKTAGAYGSAEARFRILVAPAACRRLALRKSMNTRSAVGNVPLARMVNEIESGSTRRPVLQERYEAATGELGGDLSVQKISNADAIAHRTQHQVDIIHDERTVDCRLDDLSALRTPSRRWHRWEGAPGCNCASAGRAALPEYRNVSGSPVSRRQ